MLRSLFEWIHGGKYAQSDIRGDLQIVSTCGLTPNKIESPQAGMLVYVFRVDLKADLGFVNIELVEFVVYSLLSSFEQPYPVLTVCALDTVKVLKPPPRLNRSYFQT